MFSEMAIFCALSADPTWRTDQGVLKVEGSSSHRQSVALTDINSLRNCNYNSIRTMPLYNYLTHTPAPRYACRNPQPP